MCRDMRTSSLSTTIFEFYTLIYPLIFKPNHLLQKYRKYRIRCNPSNQLCTDDFRHLRDETNDASLVSCQSLLNHGNFSVGLCIKQRSSRGPLQRFFSSSLQLNRSIILPFLELMEKEPRHLLVQNCLHSTCALEQLPLHFLRVSCTSVSDVFF